MAPSTPAMKVAPRPPKSRQSLSNPAYLRELELNSHFLDVQQIIRDAIRRGAIRVLPMPGNSTYVRIMRNLSVVDPDAASDPPAV